MYLICSSSSILWCNLDGVGPSNEEGVSMLQGVHDFVVDEKLLQFWVGFDVLVPLTFPLFYYTVPVVFQLFDFLPGTFVHFAQSAIWMYAGMRVTVVLETFGAAVP